MVCSDEPRGVTWSVLCHACCVFLIVTKLGQLILMKIIELIAIRCQILRLNCVKFNFGCGSAPGLAGKASSAPLDFLGKFQKSYF